MRKIKATTFVICPVGTLIEHFENFRPSIGREFDIIHIDTKKVAQRAMVSSVSRVGTYSDGSPQYRIVSKIIK